MGVGECVCVCAPTSGPWRPQWTGTPPSPCWPVSHPGTIPPSPRYPWTPPTRKKTFTATTPTRVRWKGVLDTQLRTQWVRMRTEMRPSLTAHTCLHPRGRWCGRFWPADCFSHPRGTETFRLCRASQPRNIGAGERTNTRTTAMYAHTYTCTHIHVHPHTHPPTLPGAVARAVEAALRAGNGRRQRVQNPRQRRVEIPQWVRSRACTRAYAQRHSLATPLRSWVTAADVGWTCGLEYKHPDKYIPCLVLRTHVSCFLLPAPTPRMKRIPRRCTDERITPRQCAHRTKHTPPPHAQMTRDPPNHNHPLVPRR